MKNVKGISQFAGVVAGAKKVMDDGEYKQILEKYHDPDFIKAYGGEVFDKRRAIELGMCGRLVENMCKDGAQPEDFKKIVLYAYLCIDAVKYNVDIFKAAEDLEIKGLATRYMKNNSPKTKEETK